MKTAIVTGSSSGFGLLCALELAKEGFHVVATMRDPKKSDTLLKLARERQLEQHIEIQALDVTSSLSIQQFKQYIQSFGKIEVLVNNAGYALGGFCEELQLDDYRQQFETNVFGVIGVTQAVLPFMRQNRHGRIINISSISGLVGFPGLSPYTASKHALEGFSESLRLELKPFGIDVVLVEPGSYKTNIWSSMDTIKVHQDSPYYEYMTLLMKEINSGKAGHGNPEDVAKLVAKIAVQQQSPELRYPIGKGIKNSLLLKKILPWNKLEKVILKKLGVRHPSLH
ncbi:short-chain dehydrogenase [Mesobacillus campisalis]|uniref:Short-chain dehydrogenase n=1 Tax=Mesobacillus campisalis TaxID=1408103 RepID=A0A0M2SWM8_9BACI|nr:short-chain dehydrogenase [Mesobacillus campisalis]